MRAAPKTSKVFLFLSRARELYAFLGIERNQDKKIQDKKFMEYMGLSGTTHKNWYSRGTKTVYWRILEFIEENKKLKEDKAGLLKDKDSLHRRIIALEDKLKNKYRGN